MILYVVLSSEATPSLGEHIQTNFPDDSIKIADGQWIVAVNDTPQGVVSRLDAGDGKFGKIAVFGIEGYYGWHRKAIWDWIALKRKL